MSVQFSHPYWLWLLLPVWGWIVWLTRTSDVQLGSLRRWLACATRLLIVTAAILALAGIQWQRAIEGLNVFFLLDRSESVPSAQQEQSLQWVNRVVQDKPQMDRAGVMVFANGAAIESWPSVTANPSQIQAVIPKERTDIGGTLRLATAAFPETGQQRIVLMSDGNENLDDAFNAALSARASGVSIDVVPLGTERDNVVSVRRLEMPSTVAKGQAFEAKVFVQAARAIAAKMRFYRNNQYLGEKVVQLEAGKNLFTFPQTLTEPGFYNYDVRVEVEGDNMPQDNRALGFAYVKGVPRVLVVSSDPEGDKPLAEALKSSDLEVKLTSPRGFPDSIAELNAYDSIFFCNIAAGDVSREQLQLLETAVRDFGVGFVCVGGDETYTAGAYRSTPLDTILPVEMELSSKKVLPPGALVLVIDRSGSMTGEKIKMARDAAVGAVQALSDNDYVGVIAFDGAMHVVADLQKASNRKQIISDILRITADGGTTMYPPMERAYEMLSNAKASLKHCIVLTDGVSTPGDFQGIARKMAEKKITVTTVGLGEDLNGELLNQIADIGKGRFYPVPQPTTLPQIFIKETAVILKTSINEEPFTPKLVSATEPVRGLSEFPQLLGYVVTELKPRAEMPLVTEKGDPLLAHWQYGLGRTVAFTSDARSKWARNWTTWPQYQQFWRQQAQWSLRRLANADFATDTSIESGVGKVSVEALDQHGNFRNFLNLQAVVAGPLGKKQTVTLTQTMPGHYEASFPATEIGTYLLNVMQMENGKPIASQVVGAGVAYSPELAVNGQNLPLLKRIAEVTGGRVLDPRGPSSSPFYHERVKTFQSQELWEWMLRFAVIAFVLDVGLRRIQLEQEELKRAGQYVMALLPFYSKPQPSDTSTPSLAALLARHNELQEETRQRTSSDPGPFNTVQTTKPIIVDIPPAKPSEPTAAPAEEATTSRLLEAKRRAQERHREG